jgi:hypothetical protein
VYYAPLSYLIGTGYRKGLGKNRESAYKNSETPREYVFSEIMEL